MWAVYFTGCTDSFLQAMFMSLEDARKYSESLYGRKEGIKDGQYHIIFWSHLTLVDTTDTGWEQ